MDVHPAQAGRRERRRQRRQPDAVGRHREIADARDRGYARDDLQQVGAERRLAARETDLAKPDGDRRACDELDLVRREEGGGGRQREPFEGHAVHAAQVAVIRQRDAQVIDLAAESVARHGAHLRLGTERSQFTAKRARQLRRQASVRARSSRAAR